MTDTGQEQAILMLAQLEFLRRQLEIYTVPTILRGEREDDKAGYSLRQLNYWKWQMRVKP